MLHEIPAYEAYSFCTLHFRQLGGSSPQLTLPSYLIALVAELLTAACWTFALARRIADSWDVPTTVKLCQRYARCENGKNRALADQTS